VVAPDTSFKTLTFGSNGVMVIAPDCHPGGPGANLHYRKKRKNMTPPNSIIEKEDDHIFIL